MITLDPAPEEQRQLTVTFPSSYAYREVVVYSPNLFDQTRVSVCEQR